ncbi:MAG: hypothetical protein D8M58_08475 [Calditrichaeota bacterium]|nr:MAG: hypothetical protein DWQ03_18015 [Calditrichota bacterium]MBL1205417.1 hypothetical protein [Calditrichota bacterium]NOG45246.1 hypothetical protein [Calditrichota bacterium]
MFKKWFVTLLLLAGFPFTLSAQLSEKIDLQINTGTALPLSATHFEEYWNPGIHFGGGLEYTLNDVITLKWDAAFNTFVFMHDEWKKDLKATAIEEIPELEGEIGDFIVNGGNRYILETSIGAKIFPMPNETINPYLSLGAGLINMSTDEILIGFSGPDFTGETIPYFTAGVGMTFLNGEGFSLFGQVAYKYAMTKDEYKFELLEPGVDYSLDLSGNYEEQETSMVAVEFGIVFDLAKK